ncbi:MAG: PD-(D/E)XK nuclease family protein [Betaproteobacteria bacterium]|nr:PD-(D/E)XK nuclease family protein [Betaproteobacteria bacterium]MCL2887037.1 PD-(D/E)XK nuclease family protein [Betaproteobacteria bacterium]
MPDTLHLCATARLAQTLRGVPAQDPAWRTPWALTLGQWFAVLAEEAALSGLAELPAALDPFAESLLWEEVVAASLAGGAALFDVAGMAAAAAEAHALTRVWNLRPAIGPVSDEARLFTGWQAEFERRCRKAGWIDAAGLHRRLIGLLTAGHCALPARVELRGFDRRTPLEDDLLAALTGRGVDVVAEPPAAASASAPDRLACADAAAECAAAVAWAERHLAANPACRLGIVAPDLAAVRERLEFLLDDRLHPAAIRPDAAESPRCFNFSLGRPLAEQPLVHSALQLLQLGGSRAKVEQARLSALLLAGGWSAAVSEADGRALLDLAMRRELPWFTSLPALLRLAGRLAGDGQASCPRSVAALAALAEALGKAPKKQRPGQWAGLFRAALQAAGWPGERPLSSHEFQARRAFDEVLDAFARLDPLLGALSSGEAAGRLAQLCRRRVFQPETRGRPALQVLGTLESAGLEFDALWVMGMNDNRWPPPPRPNPLLPVEAQRAAGSARASAEVELDFARRVHRRLLSSAPEIVFSWAKADGDRVLRVSPLVGEGAEFSPRTSQKITDAPLPPRGGGAGGEGEAARETAVGSPIALAYAAEGGVTGNASFFAEPPPLPNPSPARGEGLTVAARLAAEAGRFERLDDAIAPPVAAGEKVSGGSALLRAQAICPAWAFYQYRLGAVAMEAPVEGLNSADRGTLVHGALELFWKQTRDSAALAALGEAALSERIAAVVDAAIGHFEQEKRLTLPARFRQLEALRLQKLLAVWLALEARRPVAFAVAVCEEKVEVDIEGIRVSVVVDRIDRLDDGRQLILDYKTGAAIDIKNWAGQRLTEPQLPLYAALVNDEVAAVAFAKVLIDKPAFAGIADERDLLPGVQGIGDGRQKIFDAADFPDWIAVVTHWRERLHAIAREVREGRAGVVFAEEKDLQYCDALPLLRLPERRRLLAES